MSQTSSGFACPQNQYTARPETGLVKGIVANLAGEGGQGDEVASDLSLARSGRLPFSWMGCTLADNWEDGRHAVAVTE